MKAWRRGLIAAVLILALAGLALLWLNLREESVPGTSPPQITPALIERGAYLARAGNCMGCHTERGGLPYAGGRPIPTPFGTVFASNLTPDRQHGLGDWSADDFWRALHHGRSRDGRLLSPAFPYPNYTLLTREDSDALYVFLRSQAPVAQANLPHELRWPYGTQLAQAVWRALYFRPAVFQPEPARDAAWNRGAYLVQGLGHCNACHAPRNALGATPGATDFSGGMLDTLGWYAPSLHDAGEASVAGWSAAELREWLKTGSNRHASALGPMAEVVLGSTQHLNEADLAAMGRYLQALPQRGAARSRPAAPPDQALRELGGKLYEQHCASCHGEQGQGVAGIYPALAGNRVVTMGNSSNLLRVILRGGFAPATAEKPRPFGMPPFASEFSERELAAIASFLRSSWGHQAGDVSELDVNRLR
ncbi:MAG: alcohol dehydrogenase [Methylibium sp.]|nr:alcohol dehydrogenase [Methylibium sp.]